VLLACAPAAPGVGPVRTTAADEPDTLVAWSRFVDLEFSSAQIVARDGQGPAAPLTHPQPGEVDIDPAVSPDGSWVAFERDFSDGSADIGLVRSDGTDEHLLPSLCEDPCAAALAPRWTPDGSHLVYTEVDGPFDGPGGSAASAVLMRTDLEGQQVERFSQDGIDGVFEDYYASFAPGGYTVFVRARNTDGHLAVFRMGPNGNHVRQLTPWRLDADLPMVSPAEDAGSQDLVVFETYGHGAPEGTSQAIATVPTTCRSVTRCAARTDLLTRPHVQPVQHFNPTWSPSGQLIAYVRFKGSEDGPPVGDIWTMGWRGDDKQRFSGSPLFEFRPSWGPAPSNAG